YGLLPRLLEVAGAARLIILTESLNPQTHRAAIDLGAKGLVLKQETSEALIQAINKVSAGEISLGPLITDKLLSTLLTRSKSHDCDVQSSVTLTPREQQVVSLVAEGLRNKEIARNLLISEATVSHHLTSIFNKLGISGRLQLVIYAHRHGINRFSSRESGEHAAGS
ncbi:MAG TPA: response regulator transcription factor, partial [Blastocatellia bacterium]|nr:response regulator transcription factor [Blastocatellia bacterium]